MSGEDALRLIAQIPFLIVALVVAARALRRPRWPHVDTAVFFGALALVVLEGRVSDAFDLPTVRLVTVVVACLVLALPYLLLRLVADFSRVRRRYMRLAEAGLAAQLAGVAAFAPPYPKWFLAFVVVYFLGLNVYAGWAFWRAQQGSRGVTKYRMQAAAAGSALFGLLIAVAGAAAMIPELSGVWAFALQQVITLATGGAYLLAFAPPAPQRRAWQEPQIRGLLGRSAALVRMASAESVIQELETRAAETVGASGAQIGLWDDQRGVVWFEDPERGRVEIPFNEGVSGRAIARQEAIFFDDPSQLNPEHARLLQARQLGSILAAPITAGARPLGVLVVYDERASIFADDDLDLVKLLADQAAIILESRELVDQVAGVQAREESARLKDDFLSAAAHDLQTPLTTLLAQAQSLERQAMLHPEAPPNVLGVQRMVREVKRLSGLVHELLDVTRTERGRLTGDRQQVDLAAVVTQTCGEMSSGHHTYVIEGDSPVVGEFDANRIAQLVQNLVENAQRYSPNGGRIRVQVREQDQEAHLTVADEGIGIPSEDLAHIFERFHRGGNVDDRHFAGMGLGLYICKGIVEEHGGEIWAESEVGSGSTFHVVLPLRKVASVGAEVFSSGRG